jgi:hypothetical protein
MRAASAWGHSTFIETATLQLAAAAGLALPETRATTPGYGTWDNLQYLTSEAERAVALYQRAWHEGVSIAAFKLGWLLERKR